MKIPKLTPRLELLARSVPQGSIAADIGTDHGYLSIWLAASGVCPTVYASDVNEGPIARARDNICKYGLEDRVFALRADGLQGVEQKPVTAIIIAGMGGELIARILEESSLAKRPEVTLLLQPMTSQPELKAYLCTHGYRVEEERVCREEEKFYTVLRVRRGTEPHPEEVYRHIGWHVLHSREPQVREYLRFQRRRYARMEEGLEKSGRDERRLELIRQVLKQLDQVEETWDETK
ncbi:MAG: tRNA (adenine(22)-N(1))-methyltransferase [Eubacteriales bacterium]|jgi:tRNA (adenine22-N1)-methyltransferase